MPSKLLPTLLLAASFFWNATAQAVPQTIRPGELWLDNRGQHIQAHGGGIIEVDGTYYWYGEDRSKDNDPARRYVACYSSKDLVHWTFRNQVFKPGVMPDIGPRLVLERPKVYFNKKTGKYVMYMHIDGPAKPDDPGSAYVLARVGIAISDKPDGDFEFVRSFRPLGKESRDIGQFIDDDGSAYLIFESRPERGFYIAKLSEDYLDVEREVAFIKSPLEGGAIVKLNGIYYVIGSGLTGWDPNPNKFATAPALEGPWSEFKDIAPHDTKTYGSQSTLILKVTGTKTTSIIFMADMWKPKTQWDSRYLWMPLEIGDGHLKLPTPRPWTIDVETGEAKVLE